MVIGGLAVTACSSSSKSSSGSSSSSSSSSSSGGSSSGGQDIAHDKSLGQAASLKLSDFPSGWTSAPATPNTSSAAQDQKLATCLGVNLADINRSGPTEVKSDEFSGPTSGGAMQNASGTVEYEASKDKVDKAFNLFASSKTPGCLQSVLGQVISDSIKQQAGDTSQITVGNATVAKQDFPTVGDQTVAYRITIPITAAGQSITAYVDFAIATKGRAGFDADFESVGTPMPASIETAAMQAVAGRLTET